jgi:hypothetical protein
VNVADGSKSLTWVLYMHPHQVGLWVSYLTSWSDLIFSPFGAQRYFSPVLDELMALPSFSKILLQLLLVFLSQKHPWWLTKHGKTVKRLLYIWKNVLANFDFHF